MSPFSAYHRIDPPTEPPECERTCGECRYAHEVWSDIPFRSACICVREFEGTRDYEDMELVDFGDTCEEWREA